MQLFCVCHGLGRGPHVGLGDDFQQWCSGAVQVDARLALERFVQRLARVFFQMRAHQPYGALFAIQKKLHLAALDHRNFELADLVTLGQIRVKIVLACKYAARRDMRTDRQPELDRTFHRATVHHRQGPRQGQVHRAGLRVGFGTECGRGAAEDLGMGGELGVGFEADYDLVTLHQRRLQSGRARDACGGRFGPATHAQNPSGLRVWKSVASWNWCATLSSLASCR